MTAPPSAQVLEREGAPAAAAGPGRAHRPGHAPGRGWRERTLVAVAVARWEWLADLFAGSAVFAAVTVLTSFNPPERLWGGCAAVSYAIAAVTPAVVRRRSVSPAVLISLGGARDGMPLRLMTKPKCACRMKTQCLPAPMSLYLAMNSNMFSVCSSGTTTA